MYTSHIRLYRDNQLNENQIAILTIKLCLYYNNTGYW